MSGEFLYLTYLIVAVITTLDGIYKSALSIKMIRKEVLSVQYFVYLVYFVFFVLPIIINLIYQNYHYQIFWRADNAMRHYPSLIMYALFVLIFSHFIIKSAKKDKTISHEKYEVNLGLVNICTITMFVCLALTIIVSGIQVLTGGYGYAYINKEVNLNEAVIGCGTVSYLVILAHYKMLSKFRILIVTFIMLCFFWIVGKRYIIAETLALSLFVLGVIGVINGKKVVRYMFIGGALILGLGFLYGVAFKQNVTSFLDYINVDFSRQYTLVYQFYCNQIGRQISVNQYDGITYLLTFFVPRFMWEDKPYPFVNYLTLSLVGQDQVEFVNAGWATTCSIFSDLFDSLWFWGLALGVFLFIKLFHRANRERRVHYKVILIYFILRLITVQISSAIVQITVVALILYISSKITKTQFVTSDFKLIKKINVIKARK